MELAIAATADRGGCPWPHGSAWRLPGSGSHPAKRHGTPGIRAWNETPPRCGTPLTRSRQSREDDGAAKLCFDMAEFGRERTGCFAPAEVMKQTFAPEFRAT